MPFYEYSCPRCGAEKEVLHGINAKPEVLCEHCEGAVMQRLISAAGFRLKGGGWYETDFKSDKRRNVAGDGEVAGKTSETKTADASSSGDSSAKSKDKSADKPATKTSSGDSGKSSSTATAS